MTYIFPIRLFDSDERRKQNIAIITIYTSIYIYTIFHLVWSHALKSTLNILFFYGGREFVTHVTYLNCFQWLMCVCVCLVFYNINNVTVAINFCCCFGVSFRLERLLQILRLLILFVLFCFALYSSFYYSLNLTIFPNKVCCCLAAVSF